MPKGVYIKSEEHKRKLAEASRGNKPTNAFPKGHLPLNAFKKGNVPYNKGVESEKKLKKLEKFKLGLPIKCRRHGEHLKWRMHSDNNVQCVHCGSMWQRNRKIKDPIKAIWRDARHHAKNKNREFNITIEDLRNLCESQENACCLTGTEFSNENLPSLDRKDSNLGYTLENIQLIQIKINRMKHDMDEQEFIEMCEKIVWHLKKKKK